MTCSNRCVICEAPSFGYKDTLCNTEFPSDRVFDTILSQYDYQYHYSCKSASAIQTSNEICDDKQSLENLKKTYELQRYSCKAE